MKLLSKFVILGVLACFTTAYAQGTVCADLVKQALATVATVCAPTGRNQACYGNVSLAATPRDGVPSFSFQKQGDLADLADVASLQLQSLDLQKKIWGIALMKVQASLPDTLPGQNVTFLLFGDVKITDASPESSTTTAVPDKPMQAFYFSTGIGQSNCAAAPASGILIQTPKGAGKITLRANDATIQLGSTAFLRAQPGGKMTVSVVEGQGVLTADGKTVIIPAGAESQVPLDADLSTDGAPDMAQAYDAGEFDALPIALLPNEIEIAPPDEGDTVSNGDVNAGDTSADSSDETGDVSDETGDTSQDQVSARDDSAASSQDDSSSSDSSDNSSDSGDSGE